MRLRRTIAIIAAIPIILLSFPLHSKADSEAGAADTVPFDFNAAVAGLGGGELREPLRIAVDERGFVYVADAMTGKVFRYSTEGESLEFERPASSASLYPIDVAVTGLYVYVLDYAGNRIIRYDRRGAYLDVLLSFHRLDSMRPVSLTAAGDGRLVTTDIEHHTAAVWTPLLEVELSLGEYGWGEGSLNRPIKGILLSDGRLAVVESGNARVQIFSPSGEYLALLRPGGDIAFESPRSIVEDERGYLYVADSDAPGIFVFTPGGAQAGLVDSYDGRALRPSALALDWRGRLYVADLETRSVLVFSLRPDSR